MAREFSPKYEEVLQGPCGSSQRTLNESESEEESASGRRWTVFGGVAILALCGAVLAVAAWHGGARHEGGGAGFLTATMGFDSEEEDGDVLEFTRFADAAEVVTADWRARPADETILKTGRELPHDGLMTVYHQTSPEACEGIMHSDFRLGSGGWCGKGIYFAMSPDETRQKAVTGTSGHGCMLEVVVDVGRVQRFNQCGRYNAMSLSKLHHFGADSILFEPPEHTGDELIIFEPRRVVKKRIVPFREEWMAKRWYGKPR